MLSEKIFTLAKYADQVVLLILVLMSVFSLGMILERFFSLSKISNQSMIWRFKIKFMLADSHLGGFEELAKDQTSLEGRAAGQALRHFKENGTAGFEQVFNSFVLNEKPELEKYFGALATVASNAPFIGLLGTVLGIMKAFNDLALSTDAGQQTVMAGISVALISTAAGLFVAIPASVFYNYFNRKVKGIFSSLECVKELGLAYANAITNSNIKTNSYVDAEQKGLN